LELPGNLRIERGALSGGATRPDGFLCHFALRVPASSTS
jgi:hypothetical protein